MVGLVLLGQMMSYIFNAIYVFLGRDEFILVQIDIHCPQFVCAGGIVSIISLSLFLAL